ncbi:MAG TPA: enoyl-CoA hydratase-related protein, partial [Candidatus Polarisedimenticolia bacterium]|nr:enoyl-CoA hydratase-related protein [Candidatus Polarisedimenticolia bacterium]
MSDYSRLILDPAAPVARLTLNRPEVRNAFDDLLINELLTAMGTLRTAHENSPETSPRALILTGAGESFCAGADMNWM